MGTESETTDDRHLYADEPKWWGIMKDRAAQTTPYVYWRQKGMSVRSANALANGGICDLNDLKKATCIGLLSLPNFGRRNLHEVQKLTDWRKGSPPWESQERRDD